MTTRRQLLAAALAAPAAPAFAQPAWPTRPVRIIVPFPAGQGADLLMRMIAEQLQQRLGQGFVVDNRAGAGGTVGTEQVARAAPDGATLGMGGSGPTTIAPSLFPDLGYDTLRDLTPIALIATVPQLFVVRADSPIRDLAGLIAEAKAKPGELFYASSGNGTTQHLNVEMFAAMAGLRLSHVPYRGSAPAIADLLGGRIGFMPDTLAAIGPQLREGRVRAIAVTSAERSPFFPDVPTLHEQGVRGYASVGWISVIGPAGLPQPIAEAAARAIGAVVADPGFAERLRSQFFTPDFRPTDAFRAFLAEEIAKWREVVRVSGAKVDS